MVEGGGEVWGVVEGWEVWGVVEGGEVWGVVEGGREVWGAAANALSSSNLRAVLQHCTLPLQAEAVRPGPQAHC